VENLVDEYAILLVNLLKTADLEHDVRRPSGSVVPS
jgi:hypothetical protein